MKNLNATGDLSLPIAISQNGSQIYLGRNVNAEIDIYSLKKQYS